MQTEARVNKMMHIKIKTNLFIAYLLFLTTINAVAQNKGSLKQVKNFGKNPGNLKMFMYCKSIQKTDKVPLLIVLHGCNQKAAGVAALTGWNKLADLHNFAALYPQQKYINNPNLCFNWFRKNDIHKNKGECASLYQMIQFTKQHYPIDTNMIFITGLSAGAAMSVVMMATYPDVFKMGAVFAGGAYDLVSNSVNEAKRLIGGQNKTVENLTNNVRKENPSYKNTYPELIIYQGLNDAVVAPHNAHILAAQWAGLFKADTSNCQVESAYKSIADITRTSYKDASGNVYMIMHEIKNLGHRILIKPGDDADEGGKTGIYGMDKGFHSTYQTAKDFGLVRD